MKKICKISGKEFEVSQFEQEFLERVGPKFGGKKYRFPLPELSPVERMRLRTMQRNEQNLFRNISAMDGASILSIYDDDRYKLYTHEQWWGNDWDPMEYGREYDFSKGFFEQWAELDREVPRVALVQVNNENCPYTTGTGYCRNCHLINCSENCEDCIYGKLLQGCKDAIDCAYGYDSELLYQCFYVKDCYNCVYVSYSQNSSECLFSENLKGCRNCFLSTNLSNKEYYFMNKPVSKEQYEKLVSDCLGSYRGVEKAKEILARMRQERVHKYANMVNCEASTGDFLTNCKNCVECFEVNDSEDCMYVQVGVEDKDVVDCSNMYLKPELSYQVLGTIGTFDVHFSVYQFNANNVLYSQFCHDSGNLFGCAGLRNKQYCVLNKQYTKEQYEELVPRIIESMQERGEWGQFFPAESSPFAYNDTVAHQYVPLTKEEAMGRGYRWRDEEERAKGVVDYEIPDRIEEVEDDICEKVLVCEKSGRGYKVLPKELKFLRRMKMPVPRLCPDERHKERMSMRNGLDLFAREGGKCGAAVESTFKPGDAREIYCEKCYLEVVF